MKMLEEAIKYAVEHHNGSNRKGKDVPYILHPLEALNILYRMDASEEVLCAGVLHDTVEDTDATIADITVKFGTHVAELVAGHSENKDLEWEERKRIALADVAKADKDEQMVVLADKLANIRDIAMDYAKEGNSLWKRFNRGYEKQSWYYHGGVEALAKLAEYDDTKPFYNEFKEKVEMIFK